MPFVRFSRDRRGYEHVYLVDAKEHGRSRVIYWFRTPPGVKVGRTPFDLATQRSLEQQYPDVSFDWSQIVAARMPPPAPVENWREKRRAERAFKRARAEEAAEVVGLENLQGEPLSAEGDNAEVATEETAAVDDTEPGGELELDLAAAEGEEVAQTVAAAQGSPNAVSGTRRKRRRRRRGRRPDKPLDAAGPTSTPDVPLDPAEPVEKPSNEG